MRQEKNSTNLQPNSIAVATDSTVSAGVSIDRVPKVSTAPLNKNGTHTVRTFDVASRPSDMATLKSQSKITSNF